MANNDTPFGLRPVRHKSGAPYNGAVNYYYVPSSYATALFVGDPVVKTGTSNTTAVSAPGAGDYGIGTLPEINKATAGTTNRITGVVVGIAPNPDGLDKIYNPASTEAIVAVCDDPDVMFEIQCEGTIAAAQVGLNGVLIYTNAGSTATGRSGAELDGGTATAPATTVGFQLKILRVKNAVDNEAGAAFTKVEVMINQHTETTASVGI
tara:strand:- start:2727 stop:3350 length:624 start_codon:yes stop_codon:yes gene_type:complete